jgi:hypothetical protein
MHPIRKIMAVCIFLALLLAIFQLSGLREHFDLKYLQQKIIDNKVKHPPAEPGAFKNVSRSKRLDGGANATPNGCWGT